MVESAPAIYQLKVTLRGIKPPIWRRFQVGSDVTFHELHSTIQRVMGWEDYHLHEFEVNGLSITDEETLFPWGGEDKAEHEVMLREAVIKVGQVFNYEYDFGDGWEHKLILEKVLPVDAAVTYPRCLAGRRACPPEDIGGVWAYQYFLEALEDPEHEEHESNLEWLGDEFDPELFEAAEVNRHLQEGVHWQGEEVRAALDSAKEFTRPAQRLWDSMPEYLQVLLLGDVWCAQCRQVTTIVDFKGNVKNGNLMLRGICARCGEPVGQLIEVE